MIIHRSILYSNELSQADVTTLFAAGPLYTIPEPSTGFLALFSTAFLLRRRRS